jgi:ATP-binding cassette, subfamily B, bacterial
MQTNSWIRLFRLLEKNKQDIISIYFFAILSGIVQLSLPLGIQAIIGFSLGASMVVSIYVLIFLVMIGVLLVGIMNMNQMKLIEKIQQKIFAQNSFDLAEKIPALDLKLHDNYYLPEKANRFFETFNIQKGLSKILIDIPTASIQIILGIILLSLYHAAFIVFGILLLFVLWVILKYTAKLGLITSLEESQNKYKVAAWLEDMARVVRSFKFSKGTELNLIKTDEYVSAYLTNRNRHFQVLLIQYKALVGFKVIITASMLIIGAWLLIEQNINIGEFIAAEIVILMIINSTEKLISSLENIYDVATGLEKLEDFLEEETDKDGKIDYVNTTEGGPQIEFINFGFSFNNKQQIIKDATVVIPANSITTISGNEGEHKSTLLKVLGTLYSEYDGNLLVNSISLTNYSLTSIRSQIGLYYFSKELFRGSLQENITMGNSEIDRDQIVSLINKLKFQSIIYSFKDGFDSEINPTGNKLSTLQIKKILLLRALIRNPKLILLDDPFIGFSSSETDTIMEYLRSISSYTTIIIATNDEKIIQRGSLKLRIEQLDLKSY